MKIKFDILSSAILVLVSCSCLQSCQNDDLTEVMPDRNALIAQGRYLAALNEDGTTYADDTERSKPFEAGTPYRLLAFTKPYDSTKPNDETLAGTLRFEKLATEVARNDGLHYIDIGDAPDKWLGFNAINETGLNETGGTDGLVSIDFYGFTYGDPVEGTPPANYIEMTTGGDALPSLKRTETVTDGELKDLMRGVLLNQNIETAGKVAGTGNTVAYTQSIMPFSHCFSKLRFQVSQQGDKEHLDEAGNRKPILCFKDLCVEKIEVTKTYSDGAVYLQDGQIELNGDPTSTRTLKFKESFGGKPVKVDTLNTDVGSMIIFPSDGTALRNKDDYEIGLNITVKSTVRVDIENMLRNTGSVGADGNPVIEEETGEGGVTWYKGTIEKPNIMDYTDQEHPKTLYFKQNASYMLIITFRKDAVRIITVIPQVVEWLPGEDPDGDHWQDKTYLGQPQMFDNIVWSDRNLGADHYDPMSTNFEDTIGYFYQSGRNIPYYPFDTKDYYDETAGEFTGHPDPYKKNESILANVEQYNDTRYRFYPIVDPRILNMKHQMSGWGTQGGSWGTDRTWIMESGDKPQIFIPEERPTNAYFDYMRSKSTEDKGVVSGLSCNSASGDSKNDTDWSQGQHRQPVSGSWIIPTSSDFMAIFPSTPHAGNITFRAGGWNGNPMGWGGHTNDMDAKYKVVRVTVPCYYEGMSEPTWRSENYRKAWRLLRDSSDFGTTYLEAYTGGGPDGSTQYEPDGDPEDGYASVYVISREREQDVERLTPGFTEDDYYIKEWGTIYAIKRAYTPQAYRMRWRVVCAGLFGDRKSPGLYVEICRYRCKPNARMNEETYKTYDWDHPAARLYFPICGLGDWTGNYINFGTECQYATSDEIDANGMTSALQIKITGSDAYNAYMAVIRGNKINRDFGKQIRPIMIGGGTN